MDKQKNDPQWEMQSSGLLERPADSGILEADVKCPKCSWETSYFPKDERQPQACPNCS